MTRKVWFVVSCLIFLLPIYSHALTALYHLHKERSDIREVLQLKTSGPDARINALQSSQLKNQPPGEYLIKAFDTQAGVPNFSGTIPKGSTMVFSLWMKKTADFGAMHPLAKLYLNNATGTPLCSAAGSSPLTTILFNYTFRCTTVTDIAVTSQDRFYLWVGANMTIGPGAKRVKAELDIEGTLNGNYDSFIGVSLHIVKSITPISGGVGTDVTITGLNFGDTQGTNMVTFNGRQATVSSWSDTSIVTSVPSGVSLSTGLVTVTINDVTGNGLPFSVPLRSGYITTVAGSGSTTFSGEGGPAPYAGIDADDVAVDIQGNLYIASGIHHRVLKVDPYGTIKTIAGTGEAGYSGDGGLAIYTKLFFPSGLAVDSMGNFYVADGHRIRKVDRDGIITTVAGNGTYGYSGDGGPATSAQLANPSGIAVDNQGNLFIADSYNHRIRKVDANGIITTVAGNGGGYSGDGGPAINASLYTPTKVAVDNAGNLYISDTGNQRVRKVDTSGIITTVIGNGSVTVLYNPRGIAVDGQGNLYVADTDHDRVLKVTPDGSTIRYAGNGIASFYGDGGLATSAAIAAPTGLALDGEGNLFIVGDARVRKVGAKITPVINSLSPAAGPTETIVTISGARFGSTQGTSTVTFNGVIATPSSWSDTEIIVPVPAGASTGHVVVSVGGESSNSVVFTVHPQITSISPTSGSVGTSVTITGSGFGATQGSSTVTFNGVTSAPTSWSNTTITTSVPTSATTGTVIVTVNGMPSNELTFTVNIPMPPEITSLSPSAGPVNSTITINGTNFGATKGGSTVTLNGVQLSTTTWSDTSITALILMDAVTGPVVVTVNGISSNSATFTVLTDALTITYPLNGSVINRPDTVIIGRLPSVTGEVGVTVNGKIAMINDQDFAVNGVGLTIGENTITATMTDQNGIVISTVSISVYSNTQDAYVKLSSNIESSLSPLSAQISLDTAFSYAVTETTLSIDGPVSMSPTNVTFPYTITLQNTGIYLLTVTVRTGDGNSYEDIFALSVLDAVAMDTLLKGKWISMIDALNRGDTAIALTQISSGSQALYQTMFSILSAQLSSIIATERGFNLIDITDNVAKYKLLTLENGKTYSYEVLFIKDTDGLWRIKEF